MCFNIQNLNLCSAVVLASPNLFTMEIKGWRSLISACSINKPASAETLNEWKLALTYFASPKASENMRNKENLTT